MTTTGYDTRLLMPAFCGAFGMAHGLVSARVPA